MPSLNIKFSGLFLWVRDDDRKTMYVLAPPTHAGDFVVAPHVTRLLLPGSPQLYDIGGMQLSLGSGGIESASLANHFDCSIDGGEVNETLLTGSHGSTKLQNRIVLNGGELSVAHAPVEFHIGGNSTQCIASEVVWSLPLDASPSVRLDFASLNDGAPGLPPIVLQAMNGQDIEIEIHHVPPSHLAGGAMPHEPVKPFQLARHLPALYNLMLDFRTIVIPLTTGRVHPAPPSSGPRRGGDPVTCGQGTASLRRAPRSTAGDDEHAVAASGGHPTP